MSKAVLTLVVLLTSITALAADVYRWVDDTGGVHYGDRIPDAQKGKAKPVSVAPGPTETERAAAEARRTHDRTLDEAGRKSRDEIAQGKTPAPTPAAGASAASVKLTCEQEWQRYDQSDACFAPFRNANGGIRAEAFKHCTEVSMPKCNRTARR